MEIVGYFILFYKSSDEDFKIQITVSVLFLIKIKLRYFRILSSTGNEFFK